MSEDNGRPASASILVVDDEEIVLVALRDTLQHEGYRVVTCANAIQALTILKTQAFSVVISDQQMPMVTGLEFLSQVKQIQPEATRILITAVLSLSTVIDAINKGEIYRFVVKPWLREELLATVRNAVQRHELVGRNQSLQAATQAMNEKLTSLNSVLEQQVARVAEQNRQLEELNRALEKNLHQSVELCLRTMETFYPALGTQARRVHEICRRMGDSVGLPSEQQQALEISAWLHDIGLVGIPRQLIKRWQETPAELSADETSLIQQHPLLGEELARFVHHLEGVGAAIRTHHEHYDGTGYPHQLKGEEIPWLGRLLAVAVAFVQKGHEQSATLDAIKENSGRFFDPEAVQALLRSLPRTALPRRCREVPLSELQPGMVLAKGIYEENGILLVPDGQKLSDTFITKLRNHDRVTPLSQALLVYC